MRHTLHLFNIFREYDGKENCAKVLEEECIKMFGIKFMNDEHDFNVASMNSVNIHDASDIQSHKLGDACRCQNRRMSGRGSRTVRLRSMVTGDKGHNVYPGSGLSMELIPYFLLD